MAVLQLGTSSNAVGSISTAAILTLSGYSGDEKSDVNAAPEELYLFNEDDANYWSYTSASSDIVYSGRTYLARLIKRGDITLHSNSLKTQINVEVALTNPFARNYIEGPIERKVALTIYRRHKNSPSDWQEYWTGFVRAVTFQPRKATIVASLKNSSLRRLGLMLKFQRTCGLPLYSARCTISKSTAAYFVTGTLTGVDGVTLTATEFGTKSDGYFLGGIFKTDDSSALQKIVYHSGTTIKISRAISALAVGDTFTAWRGCDHSRATCRNTFSNELNYGGQPYIPDKNPYTGDAIM